MATVATSATKSKTEEQQVNQFGRVSDERPDNDTPMGANLAPGGGATFRVWAPNALEVHIRLARTGDVIGKRGDKFQPSDRTRLHAADGGYFMGCVPKVREGDHYRFYIVQRKQPYKRDPYARELEFYDWPNVDCIVRSAQTYPWHDEAFRTPSYHNGIIYQFHFGTWYDAGGEGVERRPSRVCKFLDAIDRIPYLSELGVTFLQPLPIAEFRTPRALGYNGTDMFSPEMDYGVEPQDLDPYLARVNELLAAKRQPPMTRKQLEPQVNQLKAFVDLCHLYGMGVLFDVVYNHAGGFGDDDQSLFFFDQDNTGNNNDSLYFTSQGMAGGLAFAFWKREVRQFLIDNAKFFVEEYHGDGFRYDEVSAIDRFGGWEFCQDLSGTVRYVKPDALQIAEFWNDEQFWATRSTSDGGAGFDSVLFPGMRQAMRETLQEAASGRDSHVSFHRVRDALWRPEGFGASWQTVQHLENHDRQRVQNTNDREPRVPALCDSSDPRSWYARSRSRVANGILLTAPGIPMLFMGQEFLEDKYWTDDPEHHPGNLLWWDGLEQDGAMQDHLRFTRELIRLRHRHPALRSESINPFYVHDVNRVLAFHRWLEGVGRDVVVVASLNESTFYAYDLGFPQHGHWHEVFNSDVYDNWVNPQTSGNGGSVFADGGPRDGMPFSASITIPANGLLVFARDMGN
jgi:1,4-alpha-glucan branching enzyme